MILDDMAMIAADTSRTAVYLDSLAQAELIPGHVIVMRSVGTDRLPGQQGTSPEGRSLDNILRKACISVDYLDSPDINSPEVVEAITNRPESVMIYSGYGGAILRAAVLGTGKRFLHVHGGYLPDFKGSTTNYYSLIANNTCGASAIFLTNDIDGGPLLLRRKFPAPTDRTTIDHGYDSSIRAKVLVEVIRRHIDQGDWRAVEVREGSGELYFIIHPVLKHIAILATR